MKALVLVSCVSLKKLSACKAKELYVSPWFLKARQYAERFGSWYILSAKYGLVHPNQIIAPYEQTLLEMSRADRELWAQSVLVKLVPLLAEFDTVVFLAGIKYRQFIVPALEEKGIKVVIPMDGLRIGEQLSFMKGKQ